MDRLAHLLESTATSPWVYLVIVIATLLDAFLPVVPSEAVVIGAGMFAASLGRPNLIGVIVAATVGAFVGDHVAFAIGRTASGRSRLWIDRGPRRRATLAWARRAVAGHGGLLLVAARFVPGGRTATTITMGAVDFPLRSFATFDLAAATAWATYASLIGYVGGAAYEQEPLKGLVLGFGLALVIPALIEGARRLRAGRAPVVSSLAPAPAGDPAEEASPSHVHR